MIVYGTRSPPKVLLFSSLSLSCFWCGFSCFLWFVIKYYNLTDLEPPYPRPKTSARTAQRLIAQVMGIKPSTEFGSNDLRKQEEARKNRIVARKSLRDDAWGSDDP